MPLLHCTVLHFFRLDYFLTIQDNVYSLSIVQLHLNNVIEKVLTVLINIYICLNLRHCFYSLSIVYLNSVIIRDVKCFDKYKESLC